MPFQYALTDRAANNLSRLDRPVAKRIANKIRWLATNAETFSHIALTGKWHGLYRLRVGDYRIIYAIDYEHTTLVITLIGHRNSIYDE